MGMLTSKLKMLTKMPTWKRVRKIEQRFRPNMMRLQWLKSFGMMKLMRGGKPGTVQELGVNIKEMRMRELMRTQEGKRKESPAKISEGRPTEKKRKRKTTKKMSL